MLWVGPPTNQNLNAARKRNQMLCCRDANEVEGLPLERKGKYIHWMIMANQALVRDAPISMAFIVKCAPEGAEAAAPFFVLFWGWYWVCTAPGRRTQRAATAQRSCTRFAACGISSIDRWLFRRSTCLFVVEALGFCLFRADLGLPHLVVR